ncbi:MAG: hypothetical protein HZC55_28875, partial [Verrucomicrobia bacterium]|nr:hypothetical protein [Verrucomicrobiota bacterium]
MKPFPPRSTFVLALACWAQGATSAQAAMSRGFNRRLEAVVRSDVREQTFDAGTRRYTASIG